MRITPEIDTVGGIEANDSARNKRESHTPCGSPGTDAARFVCFSQSSSCRPEYDLPCKLDQFKALVWLAIMAGQVINEGRMSAQ